MAEAKNTMTLRRRLDLLEASRGRLGIDVNEMSFAEVTYELAMISTPDDLELWLLAVAAESSRRSIRASIESVWASYGMHGFQAASKDCGELVSCATSPPST